MKKCIVIAGASGGLGKALANEYVKQGYQVFGCGRRDSIELNGMVYQSVDLTDSGKVASWIDDIVSKTDQIELCVNCSGSLSSGKKLWEFDSKETQSMIDSNLVAFINLLRVIIPVMEKQGSGRLVTMASNPEGYPIIGLGLYASCKTAIEKLIEVLGKELPHGIIALALYPGLVNTPMLQKSIGSQLANNYPTPEEWAGGVSRALLNIDEKYQGLHVALEKIISKDLNETYASS